MNGVFFLLLHRNISPQNPSCPWEFLVQYMKLALQLAEQFRGKTSPNPLVGAVVVQNGKIVGKGAHQFAGGPHAEVYALTEAGDQAKAATLYVTLEPCCHYGKTPPCTDRIISAGIAKVIVATLDPNPLVAGKGIQQLRSAGIEVEVGMCGEEARQQNEIFLHYITTKMPFVTAKAAISLDGKIATAEGDSKWISNEESRREVHVLRSQADAVLIGKNTFLKDNPRLNVRLEEETEGPQKIVVIPKFRLDVPFESKANFLEQIMDSNVYKTSIQKPLIVVCHYSVATPAMLTEFKKNKIEVIPVGGEIHHLDLRELLQKLGEREITSLLLEGGSGIYTSFLQAGLINKFHIFQAPILVGNDGIPFLQNLQIKSMSDCYKMKIRKTETLEDNIHWELIPSCQPWRSFSEDRRGVRL